MSATVARLTHTQWPRGIDPSTQFLQGARPGLDELVPPQQSWVSHQTSLSVTQDSSRAQDTPKPPVPASEPNRITTHLVIALRAITGVRGGVYVCASTCSAVCGVKGRGYALPERDSRGSDEPGENAC
jgi:hypothetical protein